MKKFQRCLRFCACLLVSTMTVNGHANEAQQPPGFGDWSVECKQQEDALRQCMMSQIALTEVGGEQLLRVAISFDRPFSTAQLLVVLPLGISLHHVPIMRIDDEKDMPLKPDFCLVDGCYSRRVLTPVQLEALLHMSMATVNLVAGSGDEIKLPVSGRGSRAAFNSTE